MLRIFLILGARHGLQVTEELSGRIARGLVLFDPHRHVRLASSD